ncbi:MAG: DinB family protein [Candidatus Limnocylindria bacterium]
MTAPGSIRLFYDHWPQHNRRLVEVVRPMTTEQLAIRPSPDRAPIWATVGHTAGVRVYWLCGVFGEPGAETTPFPDPNGPGWEDDESVPRDAGELVTALATTWRIVERCLDRWTPEMMADTFSREVAGKPQPHTRTSVLQRLFSHDAYHCGELSQTLGIERLPQIDLWRPD